MKCLPGINVYALLTVDVLHEIELGVWKSLFTHILRIIQASPHSHNELDKRCAYDTHSQSLLETNNPFTGFAVCPSLEKTPYAGSPARHLR